MNTLHNRNNVLFKLGKRNRVLYLQSKKVSCNYLVESNLKYTYISEKPFEYLESKLNLQNNNLEKRNVSFLRGITHNSRTHQVNEVLYDK